MVSPQSKALLPVVGGILAIGLIKTKQAKSITPDPQILHVLNRLSFGPRPGEIEKIKSTSIEAYIQSQLNPKSIPESPKLTQRLDRLETLSMTPVEIFTKYVPTRRQRRQMSRQQVKMQRKRSRKVIKQAMQARLMRAIDSTRQLQEVTIDFWFNHFNVFARKGLAYLWVGNYEQQAIRPHVFGRFRDLLGATARHPAMLVYLDNWLNTAPDSPGARGRFKGINENYARELMELHTLGVNGGYTQKDVVALARILTGWSLSRRGRQGDGSGFFFNPKRHDFSDKVFLGHTIKGSGIEEVERALDILATHPSTARHISYKLAQYFVADEPPKTLVDVLAKRFLETDGNIGAVLQTLFQTQEFLDPKYYGSKFKTPYQYIISAIRASEAQNPKHNFTYGMLRQLGMPIYGCQTPNGYKNTRDAWLNPDGMMRRVSFATAIANGRLNNKKPVDADRLAETLGNTFSDRTNDVIENSPQRLKAALMLGSPEMMLR